MDKIDLINYRALAREVQQLKTQLKTLEAALYSPKGQQFSSTPRSPGPKKTMEDAVAGHMKLEQMYKEKLIAQEAMLYRIETALEFLEDPAQRIIMRERYIHGSSWAKICIRLAELGYSERTVYRLHGHALLKLKEI